MTVIKPADMDALQDALDNNNVSDFCYYLKLQCWQKLYTPSILIFLSQLTFCAMFDHSSYSFKKYHIFCYNLFHH
jgi:hypothetical protein